MPNGDVRDVVQLLDITDIWVWSVLDEVRDGGNSESDIRCESVLELEDAVDVLERTDIDADGLAKGLTAPESFTGWASSTLTT